MLKTSIKKAALCFVLLTGSFSLSASQGIAPEGQDSPSGQEVEYVLPDGQEGIATTATDSEEVNYVEESEIARKMKQAEKARNAQENDSWGGAITIIAMCIVLSALIILSVLFYFFGKISSMLLTKKKQKATEKFKDHAGAPEPGDIASGEVIAAIAMALAEHFGEGHDMEDTILTIRKLRKAYSPWSSKIYNLRNVPVHKEHVPHNEALTKYRGQ